MWTILGTNRGRFGLRMDKIREERLLQTEANGENK